MSFSYPGATAPAFGPLDLEIAPGEIVLLLGPSGGGKSSLALCANGSIPCLLDGDLSGELSVCGTDPRTIGPARMADRVGLLLQDPESQLCTLTIADEVAFGPENLLVPPSELPGRIARALEAVGLSELRPGTSTAALSGGQKQRLALAALLSMGPLFLVLDEPTAQLDPAGAAAFFERLAALRRDAGIGALLIEHRVEEAASLADRAVVMDESGRIRHNGPPGEVFRALAGEEAIWIPEVSELALSIPEFSPPDAPLPLTPADLADRIVSLRRRPSGVPLTLQPPLPPGERGSLIPEDPSLPEPSPSSALSPTSNEPPILLQLTEVSYRYPRPGVGAPPEGGHAGRSLRPSPAPALASADLTLRRGEIHALVGPNGSGKSTLALIAAGLLRPSSGRVERHDRPVTGTEARRPVGYVFQNPEHQFIADTVEEELAYGLVQRGIPEAEVRSRVAAMLERYGLTAFARQHPFRLSGGQKRRLSVAVMLIEEPELLILDEPTFGQDRRTTRALVEEIRRLRDQGMTLLLVTHDMRLVAETVGRVTALCEGRTRFVGPPRDLLFDDGLMEELSLIPPPMARLAQELRRRGRDAGPFITLEEARERLGGGPAEGDRILLDEHPDG